MRVVYTEQRERQLRITLRMVQGLVVLMAVGAVWSIVRFFTTEDARQQATAVVFALFLICRPGCSSSCTRRALVRLPGRGTNARLWCVLTGALTMLASLPFLTIAPGSSVLFVGLFLVTLAAMVDAPGSAGGPAVG